VFYTSGPNRKLKLGNLQLTLKHASEDAGDFTLLRRMPG